MSSNSVFNLDSDEDEIELDSKNPLDEVDDDYEYTNDFDQNYDSELNDSNAKAKTQIGPDSEEYGDDFSDEDEDKSNKNRNQTYDDFEDSQPNRKVISQICCTEMDFRCSFSFS